MSKQPKFTIDYSQNPPSCLPTDLDTGGLIDITRIGDGWRRYLDPRTNKEHICADHFLELQRANVFENANEKR